MAVKELGKSDTVYGSAELFALKPEPEYRKSKADGAPITQYATPIIKPVKKHRESVEECCERMKCNPTEILANIALGKAVELGLMTQQDFDREAVLDPETNRIITPSGREIAAELLKPENRQKAAETLLKYMRPQLSAIAIQDNTKSQHQSPVVVLLPGNARESAKKETPTNAENK